MNDDNKDCPAVHVKDITGAQFLGRLINEEKYDGNWVVTLSPACMYSFQITGNQMANSAWPMFLLPECGLTRIRASTVTVVKDGPGSSFEKHMNNAERVATSMRAQEVGIAMPGEMPARGRA